MKIPLVRGSIQPTGSTIIPERGGRKGGMGDTESLVVRAQFHCRAVQKLWGSEGLGPGNQHQFEMDYNRSREKRQLHHEIEGGWLVIRATI
jgi:hypothetical protein